MVIKHWARFLIDAGKAISYKVERHENLTAEIERLKKDLIELEAEREREEREILEYVSSDWTKHEIDSAKLKALK